MIMDMNIVLISELFDILVDDYPVKSAIDQAVTVLGPVDAESWSKAYLACVNAAEEFLAQDADTQLALMRDPSKFSPGLDLPPPRIDPKMVH